MMQELRTAMLLLSPKDRVVDAVRYALKMKGTDADAIKNALAELGLGYVLLYVTSNTSCGLDVKVEDRDSIWLLHYAVLYRGGVSFLGFERWMKMNAADWTQFAEAGP